MDHCTIPEVELIETLLPEDPTMHALPLKANFSFKHKTVINYIKLNDTSLNGVSTS